MKIMLSKTVLAAAISMAILSTPVLANKADDDIETAAKNTHVFKTYLKNEDVKVDVDNGVATLTGKVHDDSHKSLAQETVASLPGVKSVNNKITIDGKQPNAKSDEWLVTKVKSTLLFHKNVSALTEVTAKNGVVTLTGTADSQAEKDLTTEYAADVEGVKDVKNSMTVASTPSKNIAAAGRTTTDNSGRTVGDNSGKTVSDSGRTVGDKIDDASVTAEVKMVLLSHKSTSALRTKVVTKDGIVTVSGEAKNPAEVALVTKLVSDANGVNRVNNEMKVAKSR